MEDYYNSRCLTGKNSTGERVRTYKDLQDDNVELKIIFTVDILNEGVKNEDGEICYVINVLKSIRKQLGKKDGDSIYVVITER